MSDWYKHHMEDVEARKLGPKATLEVKQTRYIDGILAGKNKQTAALDAGFTGRAAHAPEKLIESSELRAQFQRIAAEQGLTLHRVAKKIGEHLEARANQTLEGKQVTVSEAPDNRVQQKAIEQLTDLLGMRDQARQHAGGSSISLTITGPAADRLTALLSGE